MLDKTQKPRTLARTVSFRIDARDFRKALKECLPVVSKEETRYYLNGVLFEVMHRQVRFIATDGHRLVAIHTGITAPKSDNIQAIVPRDATKALIRALAKRKDVLTIQIEEYHSEHGYSSFKVHTGVVPCITTIDGTYPDWRRLVPNILAHRHPDHITVNVEQLRETIEKVQARMFRDDAYRAGVTIEPGRASLQDRFDVHAPIVRKITRGKNKGQAFETTHVVKTIYHAVWSELQTGGSGHRVGFNAKYLSDMLDLAKAKETLSIVGDGAHGPQRFVFRKGDDVDVCHPKKPGRTLVLMPVRI